MLTLTRSVGESIRIGEDIEVFVIEVRGGTVRLGFKAPREVTIHREEVYRQIAEANALAAEVTADVAGALAAFAPAPADSPAVAIAQAPTEAPAAGTAEDAAPTAVPVRVPARAGARPTAPKRTGTDQQVLRK